MAKFKVRFKIEKLELEIEGERETLPAITHGLKQQMTGFLQAPATVIGIEELPRVPSTVISDGNGGREVTPKRKRRNRSSETEDSASAPIDFRHDSTKWGNPKQEWTTVQKAMWLLFVLSKQTEHKELGYTCIAETFNKHFRQAKAIQKGNVGRDLGKAKLASLVGEDTTKTPSAWYLTSEGEKTVQKLIGEPNLALS
jgi:hypothetical protein